MYAIPLERTISSNIERKDDELACPHTETCHGEEGLRMGAATKDVLNATQQVVGLQNQQQLTRDAVEQFGDVGKEFYRLHLQKLVLCTKSNHKQEG